MRSCFVCTTTTKLRFCHLPPPSGPPSSPLLIFTSSSTRMSPPPLLLLLHRNNNRRTTHLLPSSTPLHTAKSNLTSLPTVRSVPLAAASPSSMASPTAPADSKPFSVLFVCLGNICRSPAAEGVFRSLVGKKGLDAHFKIDSAGTIGYHEGNPADARMRAASKRRGIEITSISRPIRPLDFTDFDLILAMDMQNKDDIMAAYERWRFKESLPEDAHKKVRLMCSYCKRHKETEVPDPYYGGPQGFEKVLDLLEDACDALLDSILAENSHISNS